MQLKVGGYSFTPNSCWAHIRKEVERNEADIPYIEKLEVDVTGYLTGSGQAALTSAENSLRSALAKPFVDLCLFRDDGGRSGVYLSNATSLSGVHCIRGPSFTNEVGAEYANQRKFTFTMAGDYPIVNAYTLLINFSETMQFSGGAAVYGFKNALNGDPQKQLLWYRVPYRLVQSGESFGFLDYPRYPPAAFPSAVIQAPEITLVGPKRTGIRYKKYGVRWSYTMESSAPLVAVPTLWR